MSELPHVDYQFPAHKTAQPIAIIGEAPGADEVKQGKPFVGRSGQLLNKNLQAAAIERADCFVGNVFRFQPPGNKVAHFFMSGKMAKEAGEELDAAWGKYSSKLVRKVFSGELHHLQDALKKLKPAIIITLGATPLWALTGKEGIVALHGQQQECIMVPGLTVIPTYHPSYILRGNWAAEPKFLEDIQKAKKLAQSSS